MALVVPTRPSLRIETVVQVKNGTISHLGIARDGTQQKWWGKFRLCKLNMIEQIYKIPAMVDHIIC